MYTLGQTTAAGTSTNAVDDLAKVIATGGSAAADIIRAQAGLPPTAPVRQTTSPVSASSSASPLMAFGLLAAAGAIAFVIFKSATKKPASRRRRRSRR